MSRLAKKPIVIPAGVSASLDGRIFSVKGPKGELKVGVPHGVNVHVSGNEINAKFENSTKQNRANVGTVWSLIRNSIVGVTEGYRKVLEIEGVGYKAVLENQNLMISLGYVHPVKFPIPPGITVAVEKNTISLGGIDKNLVGQTAAEIRKLKKPEPYKGKGIRYQGEIIRRKAGKRATTTGT
ncbi:MAG: 50S ribosomal protein L6 [Candidatus Liptonbacteria bacterium]